MSIETTGALPLRPGSLPLRACASGLLGVAALAVAIAISGLVPVEARPHLWAGLGLAALVGSVATVVQSRLSTVPSTEPQASQSYLLGLVASFFLVAGTAVAGCAVLILQQVKFTQLAAFGLSFATAATLLHVLSVITISRALRAREVSTTQISERTDRMDPAAKALGARE